MTVYTWLVILLVAAAFLLGGNQKQNKKYIILVFLLLFVVMGLRNVNAVGSDASGAHGSYPISYRRTGSTDWGNLIGKGEENYNIGFQYLMKLIYTITGGDYQIFITILSLFFVFSYTRFIDRYSPSPVQSVLCFLGLLYYTFLFDALKQAIAMSILLFAFDAIFEKKLIKFIALVTFAALFHYPALVFMPAYWISKMKLGRWYLILLVALLIFTYFFRDQILNLMLDAYGGENVEATMEGITFLRNKALIMIAIVAFAALIKPPTPENTLYNTLMLFAGVAIIFQTFCGYNNIFERLADYYFHTSIVLIPLIFEKDDCAEDASDSMVMQQIKNAGALFICVFAIWRFLSYVNSSGLFTPYYFVWQQIEGL